MRYVVGIFAGIFLLATAGCTEPTPATPQPQQQDETPMDEMQVTCPNTSTAEFTLTFAINWSVANNGTVYMGESRLPQGAHFTRLVGATHNQNYTVWTPGGTASPGVELVAETGSFGTLETEVEAQKTAGNAGSFISLSGGGAVFSRNTTISVSGSFPLVSLASMLAPSPDWFVGLSGASLLNDDCSWKDSVTQDLRVYDAGSEQDITPFSLGNPNQSPKLPIAPLVGSSAIGFQESENQHIVGRITLTRN